MKFALIFSLFVSAQALTDNQSSFKKFKDTFDVAYESVEEEAHRFEVFAKNLIIIEERNRAEIANGGQAVHGITR